MKMIFGVTLPLFVLLTLFSATHYFRERKAIESQIELNTLQLGDMMVGSLENAMLMNDFGLVQSIVTHVGDMENIKQVQVVNFNYQVVASSEGKREPIASDIDVLKVPECVICHRIPKQTRPRTAYTKTDASTLRIATKIVNKPECKACHFDDAPVLGVVLIDVSMMDITGHSLADLRLDLLISAAGTVVITLILYWLINRLISRRFDDFRKPLIAFADGDFESRIPVTGTFRDELSELAEAFNRMVDLLQQNLREKEELTHKRQYAILEERERIARELHDGLAQFLGYINTKATAVRLMLQNDHTRQAIDHLQQLEEAARELLLEVREAILGLKTASQIGEGFDQTLEKYIAQFNRLSDVPVELFLGPNMNGVSFDTETELQLLRIIQEALTNIRKHAAATKAKVSLQVVDGNVQVRVEDNGVGFNVSQTAKTDLRYGLATMRERAEAIQAEFIVESDSEKGTRVIVRLRAEEVKA